MKSSYRPVASTGGTVFVGCPDTRGAAPIEFRRSPRARAPLPSPLPSSIIRTRSAAGPKLPQDVPRERTPSRPYQKRGGVGPRDGRARSAASTGHVMQPPTSPRARLSRRRRRDVLTQNTARNSRGARASWPRTRELAQAARARCAERSALRRRRSRTARPPSRCAPCVVMVRDPRSCRATCRCSRRAPHAPRPSCRSCWLVPSVRGFGSCARRLRLTPCPR